MSKSAQPPLMRPLKIELPNGHVMVWTTAAGVYSQRVTVSGNKTLNHKQEFMSWRDAIECNEDQSMLTKF